MGVSRRNPIPFDQRKRSILNALHELGRPIWVGDLITRASEEAAIVRGFRALLDEGLIERVPMTGKRIYYRLSPNNR